MKKPKYVELSEIGNEAPLKTPRGLDELDHVCGVRNLVCSEFRGSGIAFRELRFRNSVFSF